MSTNAEKQAFASRLHELCTDMDLPAERGRQSTLGKLFGVTPNAARKWLLGEGLPELDVAMRIAKWAEVNFEWLMTGRGPKSGDKVPVRALAVDAILRHGSARERAELVSFLKYKIEHAETPYIREEKTPGFAQGGHMGHVIFVVLHLVAVSFGLWLLVLTIPLHLIYAVLAGKQPASTAAGVDQVTPETHVRCPHCRELVRVDASKCKHCGSALVPQAVTRKAPAGGIPNGRVIGIVLLVVFGGLASLSVTMWLVELILKQFR